MAVHDHSASASIPSSTGEALYKLPSTFLPFSLDGASWWYTTAAVLLSLLVLEQTVYRYKKRHLPGDAFTIPIIGKFADSTKPTMAGYMKQWQSGALSALSVFNIILAKLLNSPNHAEPCLVYSAKVILRPENWVFLTGKTHVDYRRSLNILFTRRAIGMYVGIQDSITREHFRTWPATSKREACGSTDHDDCSFPEHGHLSSRLLWKPYSSSCYAGNQRQILGHHSSARACQFPLCATWHEGVQAKQAANVAMEWLRLAARNSKIAIANGAEPTCLIDEWMRICADPNYKGRKDFSDDEISMVVFSFLFASQDAMSSGLIFGFQHLADHPETRVRQGNFDSPLTIELMDQMPYLQAVVKESMRVKPPVTMVPYKTTKAFPISEDYTVPANSMVIPSFYNSLHDPNSANMNPKNYLVWGSGPHRCIGLEYAMMNMALVLATAAVMFDWEHEITPKVMRLSAIIATLFPRDGCRLKLTPRTNA
ncbi:cytochrome P450 sterol C22-desaturase [Gymnopus androsaceus JB14]|uniref:Cytochrome P450 sterol C22-desaturase n=1 Tax=Gymnopus androsaceus JB14 TaxID=1447944 RepID=A0A6A4IH54_9AGAR|nr:cytochrome P450 sterol C22-desaturase [Gymnopus androsaceus JB14]